MNIKAIMGLVKNSNLWGCSKMSRFKTSRKLVTGAYMRAREDCECSGKHRRWAFFNNPFIGLFAIIIAFHTIGMANSMTRYTKEFILHDQTPAELVIIAKSSNEKIVQHALDNAANDIMKMDKSLFSKNGLQDQINTLKKNQALSLPTRLLTFIQHAKDLSGNTKGWFDITSHSKGSLFANISWRRLKVNMKKKTLTLKKEFMTIDLAQISKGYFADQAINTLVKRGYNNIRAQIGTSIRNIGNDLHSSWQFEIAFGGDTKRYAHRAYSYNISNAAVSKLTPTQLPKTFVDGHTKQRINHHDFQSVTIFAHNASTATAYGLAIFAMGKKMATSFIDGHPEIKGIIVFNDGTVHTSDGLKMAIPSEKSDTTA